MMLRSCTHTHTHIWKVKFALYLFGLQNISMSIFNFNLPVLIQKHIITITFLRARHVLLAILFIRRDYVVHCKDIPSTVTPILFNRHLYNFETLTHQLIQALTCPTPHLARRQNPGLVPRHLLQRPPKRRHLLQVKKHITQQYDVESPQLSYSTQRLLRSPNEFPHLDSVFQLVRFNVLY